MGETVMAASPFPAVEKCSSTDRGGDTVVADLDGTLLCGRSSFPYFAHMAFETGGVLLLIVLAPLAGLLYYFVSEAAGIQVLIFASMAGARVPKFYCSDLHPESWRVFSACGRRCVLTANPRVMVEAFLKDYIGADVVVGTELVTWRGRATGLVRAPGVLVGERKADALRRRAGGRARRLEDGLPVHEAVQGGVRGARVAEAQARAARGPAAADCVPRRAVRAEAVARARAAHRALDPDRVSARVPPHRRRRAPADAHGVPRFPRPRRPCHHQGQPSSAGQPRDGPDRRAVHLLPPHPPRPNLPLHRARPPHHHRHPLGTCHHATFLMVITCHANRFEK
jgi:phosphoserine phosphatase